MTCVFTFVSSAARARRRASVRATMTTSWPSFANSFANSLPSPEDAPVTSATAISARQHARAEQARGDDDEHGSDQKIARAVREPMKRDDVLTAQESLREDGL